LQGGEFLDSEEFGVQLLRSLGFRVQNKGNYTISIPRLTNDSIINSQNLDNPYNTHLKQSEYFIPGWADTRWDYRKNITIDSTKVLSDLTNFPVLIDLYDRDLKIDAQANGNDIFFADSSGQILDHEVELYNRIYNSTHAHLVAWVEANLSSTQDTIISMYFGNPTISNQENTDDVWDTNYVGVWHLAENGNGAIDEFKDSSQFINHGQGGEGNSSYVPTRVDGKIGHAQDFNNLDGYYDLIDCGNDTSLDLSGNQITIEAWAQHNITSVSRARGIVNHKGWYDGYSIFIPHDSSKMALNLPGETHQLVTTTDLTLDVWHHIVATYDGSTMRIYIDGVQDSNTMAKTGNIEASSINEIWIGHADQPADVAWSGEWEGLIDEVRISNVSRNANWIKTEYNNQNDPQTFLSIGSKQSYKNYDWPFPMLSYRKKIIINADKVSSDLTDFALLIDLYDVNLHDTTKVQADGDDILFADASGIKLGHEIEFFDQAGNGTHAHLVAWIRIPHLPKLEDTSIFMYYGNNDVSSLENPSAVWNNNYLGVWHLSEASGSVHDSTSNSYDGLITGAS
jgi:hypothetical protein